MGRYILLGLSLSFHQNLKGISDSKITIILQPLYSVFSKYLLRDYNEVVKILETGYKSKKIKASPLHRGAYLVSHMTLSTAQSGLQCPAV